MAEHHAEIVRLRAEGHSYRTIGRMTGYDHSTVWRVVRQHLADVGPSRDDAEQIRSTLYAEHEMVKEALLYLVFTEDEDGNPGSPDLKAVAAHLARAKEQAELYHLHGKQDEVTHHEGEVNTEATAKAERAQLLIQLLGEKGLDHQPVLDEARPILEAVPVEEDAQRTESPSAWQAAVDWPLKGDGHGLDDT